ncbi:NAD(P)-dependent oxidoreductase, partial [Bacillus velezensis]
MNPMDRQTEGQKPQVQNRQPGIESDMEPKPLLEDPDVKGSGRLKGKVAVITGGD